MVGAGASGLIFLWYVLDAGGFLFAEKHSKKIYVAIVCFYRLYSSIVFSFSFEFNFRHF
jgi:hypothetical protein